MHLSKTNGEVDHWAMEVVFLVNSKERETADQDIYNFKKNQFNETCFIKLRRLQNLMIYIGNIIHT